MKAEGKIVAAYQTDDFNESLGVNDRLALAEANRLMRKRINQQHMRNGVTLIDPDTTYIDDGVEIGADTLIEAGVVIKGATKIGEDCVITASSQIIDSQIGDDVTIKASVVEESRIYNGADVGPNAHLRPKADIKERAHIGNFVEIKMQRSVRNKSRASLLCRRCNARKNINVGCGVVFVNYDGKINSRQLSETIVLSALVRI